MATKYGVFSEHEYIPPVQQIQPMMGTKVVPSELGPNVKVGTAKRGKNNDACFDKFKPLSEGDKYEDPFKVALRAKNAQKAKNLTDTPFKMASPLKKSVTPGDFFGTSGKVPYIPPGTGAVQKKKGEIPEIPKGIYTSPAKKGSYGFNKTTLSERMVGTKGISTEYEYQHDPTTLHDQKRREAAEASRKAKVTDSPFRPSNPAKKGTYGMMNHTISKGQGVVGEYKYEMGACPMRNLKKGDVPESPAPFKPSNVHVSNRTEKIEYLHDPEAVKIKAESERRMAESAKLAASGAWRPNMGRKTDMVSSIVRMNLR